MADRVEIATYCGIAAAILSLGGTLLASIVAPPETFTWSGHAISDLGRWGTRTFPIFNGGLILSGLVGSPFIWRLWIASRNHLERLGTVLLAISVVGTIGVGIFFLEHYQFYGEEGYHELAALLVFGTAPFASWVYGTGAGLAGDGRLAVASFWFGNLHPLGWLGWLLALGSAADTDTWFAIPEIVASIAFSGWIISVAVSIHRRDDSNLDAPNR